MLRACNRVSKSRKLGFYRFPKYPASRRQKWIQAVKRQGWEPPAYLRICGSLFVSGQLVLLKFTVSFLTLVSFLTGKPDDRVGHVDNVTTIFAFSRPVDKRKLSSQIQEGEERIIRKHLKQVATQASDKSGEMITQATSKSKLCYGTLLIKAAFWRR